MSRKPVKAKSKAKRPVARKPPKAEGSRVRDLEKRLAEALKSQAEALEQLQTRDRDLVEAGEQQTATSEILRVISSSPADTRPVLDMMAESAARLCEAADASIFRVEGDRIRLVAQHGTLRHGPVGEWSLPLARDGVAGRAVLEARTVHVADVLAEADEFPVTVPNARRVGFRAMLGVPLVRDGVGIGAIAVLRGEPGLFGERQVALLETFADQAVIAIENVRLFTELQEKNRSLTEAHAQVSEALEQQTATADILRVISASPTDVQPVFDTIVRSAVRLCDGLHGFVGRFDGELIHFAAQFNYTPEALQMTRRMYPRRPDRGQAAGRAILTGAVVNIPDVQADPEYARDLAVAGGWRSILNVPMLREGTPIGTIGVIRGQAGPFAEAQVQLLRTFAAQAVIAVENVRLFTELQEKNRALTLAHERVTDALDQQTATAEILRVISRAQQDVQPVFDTIVRNAARLCQALNAAVFLTDGRLVYHPANYGGPPEAMAAMRARYPLPLDRHTSAGIAILTRSAYHVPDTEDPSVVGMLREAGKLMGFRSMVTVPMLRDGEPVGALAVTRREPGRFSEAEVALLRTFADQAVIAIENARLFNELQTRTAELTRSVDELTALGQVSQALSSTLDIDRILTTIVSRSIDLSGADGGSVYEYDHAAEEFRLRATRNFEEELVEASRAMPLRRGGGALGTLAARREPVQIADISDPAVYQSAVRDVLLRTGYRALLAVPLLREDRLIGGLVVGRKTPGVFSPGVVDLLTTFASQSALAIQNARLFQEIQEKSQQLEAASRHKSEFLANMSHELRTPLNAIIGFSEVLTERMFGEVNEKQEEYLHDIHASGQHLLSLINDILDLSKIEAGHMELELRDFDLRVAIDNALTLVRERASRHGIALHHEIDAGVGPLRGDERKLKQVLLNLLSNAIKFTPEGGRIEVRAALVDGRAEVAVADTGVGIAPEDQEAVFEEFRQVGTAAKKVEGTGLGLALSRKFVELHGGRIWVESQVGSGSTFTFTIPVRGGS